MGILTAMERIEEIFLIKSEGIDLIGILLKGKGSEASVLGKVSFHDGEELLIKTQSDDRTLLRDRFISTCQGIAHFYGTKVIEIEYEEIASFLSQARYMLN